VDFSYCAATHEPDRHVEIFYVSLISLAHSPLEIIFINDEAEIDAALDLLWRVGVYGRQIVMGLGFYGRSFTLKDSSCNAPGCPFIGGADPGPCTGTAGILSYQEINQIIADKGVTPILDRDAGVKYMSWGGNQW
jgi:chitinase